MDAINKDIRYCWACRGSTGWKDGKACSCGLAFPSKLWLQPDRTKWRFYCHLDWTVLLEESAKEEVRHDPYHPVTQWVRNLIMRFGMRHEGWPQIGCGCRFVPYAKGMSMVVDMHLPDKDMDGVRGG